MTTTVSHTFVPPMDRAWSQAACAGGATVLAVVGAGLFAASPGGIALIGILAAIVWAVVRPLEGRERRVILVTLLGAMAIRIAIIAMLPLAALWRSRSFVALFPDSIYMIERSIWIRNAFVGAPFAPRDSFEAFEATYGWSGFNYALAYLHVIFGPAPYAAHLFSTVLFFGAVALMYREVRRSFGATAASVGLVVICFLPTMIVWSTAPLKEAPFCFLFASAVSATMAASRAKRLWQRAAAAGVVVLVILAARGVQTDSALLAAAAIGFAIVVHLATRGWRWTVVVVVIMAVAAAMAVRRPRVRDVVEANVRSAINRHMGHTNTAGHSYKLLDPESYTAPTFDAEPLRQAETARYFLRAGVRFLTVPEPWILKPGPELALVPQQMVWYLLLALAPIGLWIGTRRHRLLTLLLLGNVVAGMALIGPNSGNIGTLMRHRDTIVPFVVWLSALGGVRVAKAIRSRVNPIDAAVFGALALLIPLGYALAVLFHDPAPRIEGVEPAVTYAPTRVTLRGAHFKPYLRAFVAPTGQPLVLLDRHDPPPQAVYSLVRADRAEIVLPPLAPATYDLALFDGSDEVARLAKAFVVDRLVSAPTADVTAFGRFVGLDADRPPRLEAGMTVKDQGELIAEILEVEAARPEVLAVGPGIVKEWVRLDRGLERPATVRFKCQLVDSRCRLAGQPIVAGEGLSVPFAPAPVRFVVDYVGPDSIAGTLTDGPSAMVDVEFVIQPSQREIIRPGDWDHGTTARPARLVRIDSFEPATVDNTVSAPVPGVSFTIRDTLLRVRARMSVPVLPDGTLSYRNNPRRVGDVVPFETTRYTFMGRIVARP